MIIRVVLKVVISVAIIKKYLDANDTKRSQSNLLAKSPDTTPPPGDDVNALAILAPAVGSVYPWTFSDNPRPSFYDSHP